MGRNRTQDAYNETVVLRLDRKEIYSLALTPQFLEEGQFYSF